MEFVDKNIPINKVGDKKKTTYFIKNNALRFYFAYIYGRQNILSKIGKENFYKTYMQDSIVTYISYRFEEIVRTYFSLMVQFGKITGIYDIGTYYFDDPINKKNGEFDIALKVKDGYEIIETKYLKDKVNNQIIKEEIKQIKGITEINVKDYGFVSINGYQDKIERLKYLIDGDDIYLKNKL